MECLYCYNPPIPGFRVCGDCQKKGADGEVLYLILSLALKVNNMRQKLKAVAKTLS